jgi:hypothetical protein
MGRLPTKTALTVCNLIRPQTPSGTHPLNALKKAMGLTAQRFADTISEQVTAFDS